MFIYQTAPNVRFRPLGQVLYQNWSRDHCYKHHSLLRTLNVLCVDKDLHSLGRSLMGEAGSVRTAFVLTCLEHACAQRHGLQSVAFGRKFGSTSYVLISFICCNAFLSSAVKILRFRTKYCCEG
jgi:hypothetical protein